LIVLYESKIAAVYCIVFFIVLPDCSNAASVDTVEVFSNGMHRPIKTVVIKPNGNGEKGKRFPVNYLLHGAFGVYANWVQKLPHI